MRELKETNEAYLEEGELQKKHEDETEDEDNHERLKCMNPPSMKYRRERGDMIETYKNTHGLYSVNSSLFVLDTCNKQQLEDTNTS